jgi:spore germination protein GerM
VSRVATPARPGRRRIVAAAALAALAALAGGCGIPADDEPRTLSPDQVPETTVSTLRNSGAQRRSVVLYFVRFDGDRDVLTPVDLEVPVGGESGMPTPSTVLDALLSGVPASVEDATVTKIPPGTDLARQPQLRGGTLTIDLDSGISAVQGDGSRLAYGQMVCTVDGLDGVDRVAFEIEGRTVHPLDGDGDTADGPLTCASYRGVLGAGAAG